MIFKFFQDDTLCPMLNRVKYETFGVPAGGAIFTGTHPIVEACMQHPVSYEKDNILRIRP